MKAHNIVVDQKQLVEESLASALELIRRAERDFERVKNSVNLIAVSKNQPLEKVQLAISAGQRLFGENRVQEAQAKWAALRAGSVKIELHLIGPLQTNKVKDAVALFDVIETVNRPSIAAALAAEIRKTSKTVDLFIQVNTGVEPQKAGVAPADSDRFIDECRERFELDISGLMCIPPVGQPAAPHFALLAAIAKRNAIESLSMGMSADFELAIQLGATHVRLGTAIFGNRT